MSISRCRVARLSAPERMFSLGVRQIVERDLEGRSLLELGNALQQLLDDLLVLAVSSLGNVDLEDGLKLPG